MPGRATGHAAQPLRPQRPPCAAGFPAADHHQARRPPPRDAGPDAYPGGHHGRRVHRRAAGALTMAQWLQWVLGCATCLALGAVLGWFIAWNARRGDHG